MTASATSFSSRRASLGLAAAAAAGLLAGCADDSIDRAPAVPEIPWIAAGDAPAEAFLEEARSDQALSLAPVQTEPGRAYDLPALIDLAQRSNPGTKAAWEQARQAALAVGMVEATYLPLITANVIAGSGQNGSPMPIPIGGSSTLTTTADGVAPFVALQWLAFDFGERDAILSAAEHGSLAANFQFNAAHQQLVYAVTAAFHQYSAARRHTEVATQSLRNARTVLGAVRGRREQGLATSVDLAQAEQLVAQGEYRVVQTRDDEDDAYQLLLGAMGLSPLTRLEVARDDRRELPSASDAPVEEIVETALARRPDILAGYAAMKAARDGVDQAQAAFMPKVGVVATLSAYKTELGIEGLPQAHPSGLLGDLFVGVTFPIYDAGLREASLRRAQSQAAAASRDFARMKDAAARQIVIAANDLNSAVEAHAAARKLASAAYKTYDQALDAYRNGIGTVSAVATMQIDLLNARLAQSDAREAAFAAAANLAFALGDATATPRPGAGPDPGVAAVQPISAEALP